MEIRHVTLTSAPADEKAVLALGFFDGVHAAHLALLRKTVELAAGQHVKSGVFTFDEISTIAKNHVHLTGAEDRASRIADAGIDVLYVASFAELRGLAPTDFISFLRGTCGAVHAVCGFNFRFGKDAAGTPDDLVRLMDGNADVLPPMNVGGEPISTTRIRKLLEDGRPDEAKALLGRAFALTAPVEHGKALGRRLGTPTINQHFPAALVIPRRGVYRTTCTVRGKTYDAVTNVGVCPTVGGATVTAESYLFDFTGDLYDEVVETAFLTFLRPEQQFADADALAAQIRSDLSSVCSAIAEKETT